jgi:hypothetical protein
MGVDELFTQSTNTNLMDEHTNRELQAQIYEQMQEGLDKTQLEKVLNSKRRQLLASKKGLSAPLGQRGLDLSRGEARGLDMSFDKDVVPGLEDLNIPFNRKELPQTRVPIGSHKGRGLKMGFNRR